MSGNSIDDATLWHFLEKLGLTKEEFHPTFGPLEKFLKQEMAKEGESLKGFFSPPFLSVLSSVSFATSTDYK